MRECLGSAAAPGVDEAAMEQAFEIFLKYAQSVR